jgi:hypothetical protein
MRIKIDMFLQNEAGMAGCKAVGEITNKEFENSL